MKQALFSRFSAIPLLLCALITPLQAEDILSELSPAQKAQVDKGTQVLVTKDFEGRPWPQVTIYQVVNATPEEVAAVFFDYEDNKNFVPNLLKSDISKKITSCTMEIDYGVDVPILPDEFYTVRNTIKLTSPEHYRVDWKLIRAVQTKDSVGCFRVEPYNGKTLICYQNLVTPGSSMAGLLRKTALSQMKDAASAIVSRAEKLKASNPAQLKKQVECLQAALQQQ